MAKSPLLNHLRKFFGRRFLDKLFSGKISSSRGIVYGAREAHNLTGQVQLLVPQHSKKETACRLFLNHVVEYELLNLTEPLPRGEGMS